jgi:acylphosphatase
MNEQGPSPLSRIHVVIGGKVSRVRFRLFVRNHARTLGLRGWVRNLSGPRVEVVAEGSRLALEQLLGELRIGPAGASVESCASQWSQATGEFRTFRVRWLSFL